MKQETAEIKAFEPRVTKHFDGMVTMSPAEWSDIRANPRQRDTATRAAKATHLRTPHPSHAVVNMARLPDGRRIKLDGHTRDFLWANGEVDPPPVLHVAVWACETVEDAKDLYSTFDSRAAVETTSDQMFGACRELEVSFESELLRSRRYAAAVRNLHEMMFGVGPARQASVYDLQKYWLPELRLLDQCNPTRKRFHSGVVAGALLTLRRYGDEAVGFWQAYSRNAGFKGDGQIDAVQALEERLVRRAGQGAISGRANIVAVVRVVLSAFNRWRSGEVYVADTRGAGIKSLENNALAAWLAAAKNTKRTW